jgi:hypothetical protein
MTERRRAHGPLCTCRMCIEQYGPIRECEEHPP